jgi:hypothetical protein
MSPNRKYSCIFINLAGEFKENNGAALWELISLNFIDEES